MGNGCACCAGRQACAAGIGKQIEHLWLFAPALYLFADKIPVFLLFGENSHMFEGCKTEPELQLMGARIAGNKPLSGHSRFLFPAAFVTLFAFAAHKRSVGQFLVVVALRGDAALAGILGNRLGER